MDFQLHHIGHAVRAVEPATESYVSRFGYLVATPVIHDPLQTAHVQFLRLPGERFWLELVAPEGDQSKLAGAVKKGGGLHHLCYTTDSLDQAIVHFEALHAGALKLILEPRPAQAFAGRRICWLFGEDGSLVELVERMHPDDTCMPGVLG